MSKECAIRILTEAVRDGTEDISVRHEHAPDGTVMVRATAMDDIIQYMKDAIKELEGHDK